MRTLSLFALGVAFALLAPTTHHGPWFHGNLLLILLWSFALVPVHELGHALAARVAGMRVFAVTIGRGPILAAGHVAGTHLTWHLLPTTGVTFAASRAPTRGGLLLYVCGGVLANAAVILVVLAAGGGRALAQPIDVGPAPVATLVWANVFAIVANLLPGLARTPLGPLPTDGLRALRALRWRPEEQRSVRLAWPLLVAREAMQRGDLDGARRELEDALRAHGPAWQLEAELAVVHLTRHDVAAARARFAAFLAAPPADLPQGVHDILVNNLAYTTALDPDADAAALADARQRSAALVHKRAPALFHGTHGAVLARAGDGAAAEPFLTRGLAGAATPASRAANAAWLALVAAQRGDRTTMDRWLARARAAAPGALEIALVERLAADRAAALAGPQQTG